MKSLLRLPLAAVGGWLAHQSGLPLAWLVGSAVVTAILTLGFTPFTAPRALFRAGQLVVGVSVGLSVTQDMVAHVGVHVALIPVVALVSIMVGRALVPILVSVGRLDPTTAHFSLIPAGISEMAELAGKHGADAGAVATFHALRVMLVVLALPPLIYAFRAHRAIAPQAPSGSWSLALALALALAIGLVAALLAARIRLPSAFMVGPMAVIALVSGAGLISAAEPASLLAVAQILLGFSIGTRLKRETLRHMPRALAVGVPLMALHGVAMGLLALLIAARIGADPVTMVLSMATGGSAEMVLTASAVGAETGLIAIYQLARGILGNSLAETIYRRSQAGRADRSGKP